ncbi:penicillin-binding protein 2 [Pediococcus pentosaceus]|uniref:peptidoglycan D,D-transpeptidase FtsI family protein n=1 Tax=Pediococcus pentosaceus TaxID=1255 RepID=UPI001C1EB07D|nr:penicillin-binding protein 2 [Pediococcus pentosaceus]MBU7003800.1 penicillin-binding protein 2 [Pediococcus pentosaceus]MCG9226514.1 penicillin-binding protein 2 [Pediococcus pentosaceus]MDA8037108.1 penicillin-binding protein 2 [Pediococcus pentosaceus]
MKNPKKIRRPKSELPFRLNLIFFVVFALLLLLVGQLGYLQILYGSKLQAVVNRTDNTVETNNVQRGVIYDSTGKVLVGNTAHQAISYTKGANVMAQDMFNIANTLGKYLEANDTELSRTDIANYLLADSKNSKYYEKKITNRENLSSKAVQEKEIDYIKNSDVKLSSKEENAARIFKIMNGAYQLSTVYIKETDVSSKELSEIGEHLSEMPGVKISTSWTRSYPEGNDIKSLAGTVSSSKTGLPSDEVNTLLAEGYARNDSVGQSYLEKQYESVLKGTKSQTAIQVSSGGQIVKKVQQYAGKKGDNLVLTINSKFQEEVQKIMKEASKNAGGQSTGGYAVVMNPKTGAVIALAGADRNPSTGKMTDNVLGTINEPIVMGSVVKGATISGALMDGVITPSNNTLIDEPIKVAGTGSKSSWFNSTGSANMSVDASRALEVSSNSYMMQLAMKEGGFKYSSGASLSGMNPNVFNKLRGYFEQFGLGTKTGIDLPGESSGFKGPTGSANIGKALDLSFGNYDAYTTIQVAQYMSTIANGGYRVAPHVVEQIRSSKQNGKIGAVQKTVSPTVLNQVDMTSAQRKLVTDGLYDVVHGSNKYKTGGPLAGISPGISAKTGTAQTTTNGKTTVTLSLASYAPSNDPQVVVALALPGLSTNAESDNMTAAKKIYAAYWKYVQSKSTLTNPTKATSETAAQNLNSN